MIRGILCVILQQVVSASSTVCCLSLKQSKRAKTVLKVLTLFKDICKNGKMVTLLLNLQFLQKEMLNRALASLLERIHVNAGNRCRLPDGAYLHRP